MSAVQSFRGRGAEGQRAGLPEDVDDAATHDLAEHDLLVDDLTDASSAGPPPPAVPRSLGVLLAGGGAVGFLAAFVLTVERFRLAENPGYVPSCSINPVLSCGSVMRTEQAALFGFPNPLLGVAAFAIATTLGLLVLSRTPLPRWIWAGLQVGLTAGMALVVWLVSQSLYSIGALCPYCMVVWAVVIPMFVAVTATNLERGVLPVPAGARGAVVASSDYKVLVVVLAYLAVVVLAGVRFWDYWSTLV